MRNDKLTATRPDAGQPYVHGESAWVVPTLVQAFASNLVANHLFPDPAARVTGMAHVFRMALRSGSKLGAIDVIRPAQAAAIWLPPGNPRPGLSQWLLAGALMTPLVAGWNATRRMLRYERFVEERRLRLMAGQPHWYLFAIGIDPGLQGRGLGSTLLDLGRRRAHTQRVPCYLETSNERNLTFYQKNGFTIIDRQTLPGTALAVWSLVSETQSKHRQ